MQLTVAQSTLANVDVSRHAAMLISTFVAKLDKFKLTFISFWLWLYGPEKHLILYNNMLFINPTTKLIIKTFPFYI